MENKIYMTNIHVDCQVSIPSNSPNEKVLLQRSDLAYSINIYFKNREVNDDNVATFIRNIKSDSNVNAEDKAFVTVRNIKDIISVHSNFKIVDGHLEKDDDAEINYEEVKTKEDHEQNMLMATDPAVIELFSNIPLCDVNGRPKINRFGTVLYHDYKEIWELLIYVANASSINDTISFEDIIKGLSNNSIKTDYDLNPAILKDLLVPNQYNKFTELFTKTENTFVIRDNALVNKLLSGISKPITIFRNLEMLVENGSFFIKEFVTNSINSTDEKRRRYTDAIADDKTNEYFNVSNSNEIIWNVDKIKKLFTNTEGNYNITYQNAIVLLKAIKVLKNDNEVNSNFKEGTNSSKKIIEELNSYFTEMFEAEAPDIRFKIEIYNIPIIHAIIPKNEKKAALSFVTKTFKKMYAAVNLNHQIKMYRRYKQTHLYNINIPTLRQALIRFKSEDPTLLHLPYIKLIELSGQSNFSSLETPLKNILDMSKLSIIDTILEDGEAERVEDLSAETQLKWRLALTNLKYAGNIKKDKNKKNINSFTYILPTNSSNKTVKIAEGFEYVTDINNGKPVYAFDAVSIESTIIANEFNRIISYFDKLVGLSPKEADTSLDTAEKTNNIKIYTKNGIFEKALNFFFCVSNQLLEINSTFFITKDSASNNPLYTDMIKDIPTNLYKTLTKLPNLEYFDYNNGKLSLKSDKAISKLSTIYRKQFRMEIKDLRKSIEKALLVDFTGKAETMSDMLQFIGTDILINTDNDNLLVIADKVEQLTSDIDSLTDDAFRRYRDYAEYHINDEGKTYESEEKKKEAINRRARVEKQMRELHLLIEAFIAAHNKQYNKGAYSTTKGSSLNNFIENLYKVENEDEMLENQEILAAFSMFQAKLAGENSGEPNNKAFNVEDYDVDERFMSKNITLSDILNLIDKYNRINKDEKLHVVLEKTDAGQKIVLKYASKENFITYGKQVYNKFTSMMYYNTLLNLYDDLNLTVGDMISFYKKDSVTGWGVEATFTNLYKRLKMIISPTVPHAPYVIVPSMNANEVGKKEFTFNNIVLKSNVTYSPQVRSTMINQNKTISNDTSSTYSHELLFAIFNNRTDLIEKVNNKTLSLFEANGKLTVKEQDELDKHFIELYKINTESIKGELKALGFDNSYFKIDMTDAFDIATLTFELKRAMLYNTNNSVIEQELYNLLYRWLHTPMSDKEDDTVFIGTFNTGVRKLRKHTNYSLEEFEKSLSSIELKKQYTDFIFYLRKDITVDFVKDPYLNNRMIFTDKNSSRVMLPTDIIGSPLNLLRLFMEVYEVDRMSHDSAIKMTSSTIYPIDFWSKIDNFKSEEEAFKFLYGETGGVIENNTGSSTKLVNNYVPIKWASIGEQVKQSQSPISLIASQSKSLVYLNQKEVDFDTLYYNGEQVTVKERKDKKTIKGIELYEEQQVIWKQIYYSRYREFTDDVFVDGIVNTEKLREFIIDSFQDTDKLKYNDLLSLNTNIFKVEEILKEKIRNSEGTDIKATYEGLLATIKEYSSKDINQRKEAELKTILDDLIQYNIITLEDSMKENFLFEYILPLFYNTNSTKIETLFTSMINNLLRIKTTGIKGALTPNVDTVKTSFISEDLKSSMVLVDPNDWTPDLHLRSTVYAEGKIHSDEIATSWNFTGEVSDYFLLEDDDFIPSNDHYGNISRKTKNTETFSIKDLEKKVKTSKNDIIKELDTDFIETMSSTFNGYSPKIHSKMVVHYSDENNTEIVAISFVRKEKGILDILDYCKPEEHTLKSSDDKKAISYPVLDLERLPKKILQGFANRIPTQSPNSMSFFKVVAFFHGGTKSTIAAPAEFIVRMGSDFDIDTLYSFIYNFFYDKSDKTFSFSEFTEETDNLFNSWLAKNRLKKAVENPNLLQLKDTFKATSEGAQKEIMKELRVLTGMLKNNENFQSTYITKNDSFNEIVDKVIAYEEEIKAVIKTLKDSGDTEGAKNIRRNKLYLYKKHTKLSDCIQSLFDEKDYLQRKVKLKTKFLEEYVANPNMIYELNDEKAVYNRLTDNYISVMSNPRNIESILAPLDFGISEGSGDTTTREKLIETLKLGALTLGEEANEENINNIIDTFNKYGLAQIVSLLKQDESFTYNPLTLLTNYRKYVAASSSKKGIGWAALHQVFTTVVELKGKGVRYIPFDSMNEEDIANLTLLLKTFTNVRISISTDLSVSDINTDGKISGYTGKGQDRSTFVSIFVDDETKQFAAKLNMVAFTFSALAGYNVLGYDFTYYSLLLSNPIIKRLENLKTFYKNRDKTAYFHLFYELGLKENISDNPSNNFEPYSLIETEDIKTLDDYMHYLYKRIKEDDEFSSDVKDLLLLLNDNDKSELANKKRAGMLLSFYMADKLGKIWGEYAVLMNKDASGISSLYSKIVNQYEDLSELFKNKNVQKLLETFGSVDFLLYSPYLPSKTITTNFSTEYPNPYELIKYIKEYDDIFTTRPIVKLLGVDNNYITGSLRNGMSIKDILEFLINYNTKQNWITALKSKTLGNTFLNTLLLIYAEKHGTDYTYKAELIALIEYLMKPQRFNGIRPISEEFITELEAKDEIDKSKGYKGFKSVYEKLLEYNTYIVNGNILFEATSHKGYALGAIQLAINTYHKYFPYATNLWKEYEKLYRKYEGKSLSYEDAMSNYSKLFKAFQILSNMFTDNEDILIARDKTKGLLMLKALKSINAIDNPELASKYYFLKDIDISISNKDYVVISYTAANSIVSEAVTDVDKIERYRIMLKDDTPISNTGVTIKELAKYLATYYVVANGANYSSRNLGSLIPSTYIQDLDTKISFDFDSEDTLSTSQKFDFLLFMFTHDPSLFMSNTINLRNKKDFDNVLFEDTVVYKKTYELTEVPKKDLLYSKKEKQLYFNIMSVAKNRGIVNKILDLYYHNDSNNRQSAIKYILEQIDLEVPPVALYVKLNNFMYNTQGVTIYSMPVSEEVRLLQLSDNKTNTKLEKEEDKSNTVLPTFAEEQSGDTNSEMYRNRTIKNAQADATIHLAVDFNTPGEILTKNQVNLSKRQYIALDAKNLNVTEKRVDTIVNRLNALDTPITGINIKSNNIDANSLGNKLTNKSENLPNVFNVEEAYKAGQSLRTHPELNAEEALKYDMNLMYTLQVKKFKQNPELIDEINANGGLEFITSSSHWTRYTDNTYTKLDKDKTSSRNKNDRWIGDGLDSNFIKVLAASYTKVSKELGKFKQNNKEIILNVAGNGIYSMPDYTQEQVDNFTYELLKAVISSPNLKVNISLIRSGGQSGFDEAGIKAGMKLGIPTYILAPKKWQYMTITDGKKDSISNEAKFKERFQIKPVPTDRDNVIAFATDYANTLEKSGKLDKAFNIRKDIKMLKNSDGFIGKVVPETSPLYDSATEKYRINWRDSANPITFSGMNSIMISGSGTWNTSVNGGKITIENIQDHFDTFYKPLIDQAVNEGVTIFNVGNAAGMDKIVQKYLVDVKGFKAYPQSDNWTILKIEKKGANTKEETPTVIGLDATQRFTRESVEKDKDYIYLFTDNAKRTSGKNSIDANSWYSKKYTTSFPLNYPTMTQAVIRGLDNAYPITTMVDDNRTQWTDDRFDEYKKIIDDEIETIKQVMSGYKGLKFSAEMPFGKGNISNMSKAPKIWSYLNKKLAEIGIDNTGDIPKAVSVSNSTKVDTNGEYKVADRVYPMLGNKTKTPQIEIFGVEGVPTFRTVDNKLDYENAKKYAKDNNLIYTLRQGGDYHFGNPFGHSKTTNTINVGSIPKSVKSFIEWLANKDYYVIDVDGVRHDNIKPIQRNWIVGLLDSGTLLDNNTDKSKQMLYWKELQEPSHATALQYLIENWKYVQEILNESIKSTDTTNNNNFTADEIKEKMKEPYKGFKNFLWYYIAEKAKEYAPNKYNSIVNAKDYHTAYLIGADRMEAYNNGTASTPGIQDPGSKVWDRVLLEFVNSVSQDSDTEKDFLSFINTLFKEDTTDDTEITDIEFEDITDKEEFVVVNVAQYTYHYYPLSDKVIQVFKNGNPDKDITNDKSKDANKVRVNYALNNRSEYIFKSYNGTEYVKVGNQIISTKTYLSMKDTNILQLFDTDTSQSNVETVEKVPEVGIVKKYSYTFKQDTGKNNTVETDFELSDEQKLLMEALYNAYFKKNGDLNNEDGLHNMFLIIGSAGTGKSSTIKYFLTYLANNYRFSVEQLALSAPTHKANKVLYSFISTIQLANNRKFISRTREEYNLMVFTTQAALGTKLDYTTRGKIEFSPNDMGIDYKEYNTTQRYSKLVGKTIWVIDEISMLTDRKNSNGKIDKIQDVIKYYARQGIFIIMMGDRKQLESPDTGKESPLFEILPESAPNRVTMVTEQRQGANNPIISMLKEVINYIDSKNYSNPLTVKTGIMVNNMGIYYTSNQKGQYSLFKTEDYNKDRQHVKIITRSNWRVKEYNDEVRDYLFDRPAIFEINDTLMGYQQMAANSTIQNGQEYIVNKIDFNVSINIHDILYKRYSREKLYNMLEILKTYKEFINRLTIVHELEVRENNPLFEDDISTIYVARLTTTEDKENLIALFETMDKVDADLKILYLQKDAVYNDKTLDRYEKNRRANIIQTQILTLVRFQLDLQSAIQTQHSMYKDRVTKKIYTEKEVETYLDNKLLNEKKPRNKNIIDSLKAGYLYREKSIDYGYAVTVLKSQGSTYKHVIGDLQSIEGRNDYWYSPDRDDIRNGKKDEQVRRSTLKALYVLLSRASHNLYLYTEDKFENTNTSASKEEDTSDDIVSKLTGNNASFDEKILCPPNE